MRSRTMPDARGDRGAVLPLVAILLPVLLIMTAFAVDLGRQRDSRRTMQARADIVALDLVRLADGRTEAQILADPGYPQYLQSSAARNEVDSAQLDVIWGTWNGSAFVQTLDDAVPNAVKVVARETIDYYFQPGTGSVQRAAIATAEGSAGFQIGSFAARIDTAGDTVLALVGSLLGLDVATDLVGYEGLAESQVDLASLLLELDLADPEDVLGTTVSLSDFYIAMADALRRSGDPGDIANAQLLDDLVALGVNGAVHLGDLLQVQPGAGSAALDAWLNALDLVTTAAQLANGTAGAEVQDLTVGLPGLTDTRVDLDVIEPPRAVFGRVGASATTDQVRATVEARILGGGPLSALANVAIRLSLGTGSGTGTITDIACTDPMSFDVNASTALLQTELQVYLSVLGIPVTVTVTKLPPSVSDTETFIRTDDPSANGPATFAPPWVEVGRTSLGLATGYQLHTHVGGILGPLLQPVFNAALNPLLNAITGPLLTLLDTAVLSPLVAGLGLNVSGADVVPLDQSCNRGRLVG